MQKINGIGSITGTLRNVPPEAFIGAVASLFFEIILAGRIQRLIPHDASNEGVAFAKGRNLADGEINAPDVVAEEDTRVLPSALREVARHFSDAKWCCGSRVWYDPDFEEIAFLECAIPSGARKGINKPEYFISRAVTHLNRWMVDIELDIQEFIQDGLKLPNGGYFIAGFPLRDPEMLERCVLSARRLSNQKIGWYEKDGNAVVQVLTAEQDVEHARSAFATARKKYGV